MSDVVENTPRPPDTPLPSSGDDFEAFFDAVPPDTREDDGIRGDLPVGDPQDNVFDVTGQIDRSAQQTMVMDQSPLEPPPNESTVVLPNSPLGKKAKDGGEPHA